MDFDERQILSNGDVDRWCGHSGRLHRQTGQLIHRSIYRKFRGLLCLWSMFCWVLPGRPPTRTIRVPRRESSFCS